MEKRRSDCPIGCSLDIFGDKWSLLIIRDIMLRGKQTYSELLGSEEKIATNILASRLKMLEAAKILSREPAPGNRLKGIYRLTQKGADLLPVIIELMDWGARYHTHCPRKELGKRIKTDKAAVIQEYARELKKQIG